ncbi:MAG: redox-sensing transcriptional repressor Rex [Christensenellaceae bacterium]|jgi:redox-sensing transcriptional repressor|nr:redox-sensing transcriptional repressor Rex [Christensenellaceae bacterium]
MASARVSGAVVRRLPSYYRYLTTLERQGVQRISSQELGARMGLTASQIRQDINCFGTLGQQGYGYNVAELKNYIGGILGLDRSYSLIIAGAGNIGRAVAAYPGFLQSGVHVKALFDVDAALFGQSVGGAEIRPLQEMPAFIQKTRCQIGVVAVPAPEAQSVADLMVGAGIRAIWNFAPVDLAVPEAIALGNVHLTDSLLVLLYGLKEKEGD